MKVLALDISTKAGWAVLTQEVTDGPIVLGEHGLVENKKPAYQFGEYPWSYLQAAQAIANRLHLLEVLHQPDVIVIEETNQQNNRYTQKLLEFIHYAFLAIPHVKPVRYISTGQWKKALNLKKPAGAKINDKLLKKAKEMAAVAPPDQQRKALNEAKKKLGIRGKWNKKMLAVDFVNQTFGLSFKLVDNDKAEAIALGVAYLKGARCCDGIPENASGIDGDEV